MLFSKSLRKYYEMTEMTGIEANIELVFENCFQ